MFKAGSFEIRRLITVQVPQSNLEDRRSDAILDIGSREQNLSTGLKNKRLLHQLSLDATRQIRFFYGSTCQQLTIKNIQQLTGNNVQSRLTWDSAIRHWLRTRENWVWSPITLNFWHWLGRTKLGYRTQKTNMFSWNNSWCDSINSDLCGSKLKQPAVTIPLWWNWIRCALHPLPKKSSSLAWSVSGFIHVSW